MPYKITGNTPGNIKIHIIEESTNELIKTENISAGDYEILNLSLTEKTIVGRISGGIADGKVLGYGKINGIPYITNGLFAWGGNDYGQLGLGDTTNISSPVQVGHLTDWNEVSAGYDHILSIKTDGTLWAWGRNDYG